MKNGWSLTKLGKVAEVIAGQSPKGTNYNRDRIGTPFYQGKKEFTDRYIGEPTNWTTQVTRLAVAGDILMSVRAPVGPVNLTSGEICIGRGLAAIRCTEAIERDFLFYFLHSKAGDIAGSAGAVFPSINKAQIAAIELSLPPLPEQRRIVGILDEAFDGIATAQANTERNLQNARALFAAELRIAFDGNWDLRPLKEVLTSQPRNGWSPPKSFQTGEGNPVLTLSAVTGELLSKLVF